MADHRIWLVLEFESTKQHCKITCRTCRRIVILPPALAIETFGGATIVSDLERRLRCTNCGERRAWMTGVYREYHG